MKLFAKGCGFNKYLGNFIYTIAIYLIIAMKPIQALIVDDELQSRSLIKKLLSIHFPEFICAEAATVADAIKKISLFQPELVFLDVQMRDETGFDLLDKIEKIDFEIIFATAHAEFAIKAFKYCAFDYLLKPIDNQEFKTSVERALFKIRTNYFLEGQIAFLNEIKSGEKIPDKLTIPTVEGLLFVDIHDILYCRAASNYTEFYLNGRHRLLSSYTLGYYDEILGPHHFFRIHRSYLVNLSQIKMYKKGEGGIVVMNNGEEIEVSRSHKEPFLKLLNL